MIMTFDAKLVNPAKLSRELMDDAGIQKRFAYSGYQGNELLAGLILGDLTNTKIVINETAFEDWVDAVVADQAFQDSVTAVLAAHTP